MHKSCLKKLQLKFCSRQSLDYEELCGGLYTAADNGDERKYKVSPSSHICDNNSEQAIVRQQNEHSVTMIAANALRDQYSSEKWKTFVAFVFLIISFFVALISLALTHDRLPDRKIYQPLPDVILDSVEAVDFLLNITEIQIIVVTNVCVVLVFFHKHRFVIARRCFFLLGILYLYRSITIYITVLPVSSKTYYCSPKSNSTSAVDVLKRALSLSTGMGLSINNKQTYCGDSIFSGHAVILIFSYLVIKEYAPSKLKFLKVLAFLNAVLAIIFLQVSHSHYSIDVVLAYYVTTRLFWTYHTLCASSLSNKNYHTREWWIFMFEYFEKHNRAAVSNEFEVPWN